MSKVAIFFHGCKGPTTIRGDPVLSLKIVFSLHLFARTVPCGQLKWTNFEVSFNWSATFGAKLGGIRELKTAIKTNCCHRFSPLFSLLSPRIAYYVHTGSIVEKLHNALTNGRLFITRPSQNQHL